MVPNSTLEYKAVYLQYCVEEIIFTRTQGKLPEVVEFGLLKGK